MLSLVLAAVSISSAAQDTDPVVTAYRAACETRDADALSALWREHPGRILPTFDADLEASLATWEANRASPDVAAIEELQDRALWAAEIASATTGHPIFADYASSFVGWTPDEKASFRGGQQAYGRALGALRDGNPADALAAATECRDRALPLGDWWGSAMGHTGRALALARLERWEEALVAAGQARNLYRDLGLTGAEYQSARILADAALALGRLPRARIAARQALAIAEVVGDQAGAEALRARLAELGER